MVENHEIFNTFYYCENSKLTNQGGVRNKGGPTRGFSHVFSAGTLFFFQFKAGRYGKFYGNVDPMTITSALREFADERNVIYIKHEQELRDKQKAIDDAESRRNAITYEQWQMLKKQKEANGQIPDSTGKSGV